MTRAALLEGPIARTLLNLAWPILAVLALQTFVGVAETYFVSFLGTSAIAGVALVFPLFMLMTMMSNGGIGGGVSSAVARAIGAGHNADAQALVWHAVVVAVAFGAVFTVAAWVGGPAFFRYMGARDETLEGRRRRMRSSARARVRASRPRSRTSPRRASRSRVQAGCRTPSRPMAA